MGFKKNDRVRRGFLVEKPTYTETPDTLSDRDYVKVTSLEKAIVTISTGKKFYVDPISRADITDAIAIGLETGQTSTTWKLAEEINGTKWNLVTISEMKEARMLGLQIKGQIITNA